MLRFLTDCSWQENVDRNNPDLAMKGKTDLEAGQVNCISVFTGDLHAIGKWSITSHDAFDNDNLQMTSLLDLND